MTVEHCVGDQARDPDWYRATGELLTLWDSAGSLADGRSQDDKDVNALAGLQQAILDQLNLPEVLRRLEAGIPLQRPGDIPPVWLLNYIEALTQAVERLTGKPATIQDLYAAFGELDARDRNQMGHLADVAKMATLISEKN